MAKHEYDYDDARKYWWREFNNLNFGGETQVKTKAVSYDSLDQAEQWLLQDTRDPADYVTRKVAIQQQREREKMKRYDDGKKHNPVGQFNINLISKFIRG